MIKGSCLCGRVAYEITGPLTHALNCHCIMCRKSHGAAFRSRATVQAKDFAWTRGENHITWYASSPGCYRGFCEACGTPLTWEHVGGLMSVTIGALDDPGAVTLKEQLGSDSKLAVVDCLADLPTHEPTEPKAAAHLASVVSLQHPDHDT